MTITHHDLCFGCGIANLFGLQLELERDGEGGAVGRFFVKQDHQGPPGYAHGGIAAAALDEAMALLVHSEGVMAVTRSFELDLRAPIPIGTFALVRADFATREGRRFGMRAELRVGEDPQPVATATATLVAVA